MINENVKKAIMELAEDQTRKIIKIAFEEIDEEIFQGMVKYVNDHYESIFLDGTKFLYKKNGLISIFMDENNEEFFVEMVMYFTIMMTEMYTFVYKVMNGKSEKDANKINLEKIFNMDSFKKE